MGSVFFELTVIICIAAILAVLFRFFKQPLILAYILTGILIGALGYVQQDNKELLQSMGELGITLLLFMLGLELRLSDFRSIGKVALLIGVFQMLATGALGYILSVLSSFSVIESMYIALAVSFSSTIIVVKLISDKRDLNSLYGKIAVGVLLVQDFFAIATLMILSGFSSGTSISITPFLLILLKGIILISSIFLLNQFILPRIFHYSSRSEELLFLVSIAWALGLAALVASPLMGFSIEIGGLLAGLSLATTSEQYQIAARVRSLRDFFIILFFVFLGTQMVFENAAALILPIVFFSWFVLTIKPIIIMAIMGFLGYRKRTSFLTGVHLSQISEFSLIVVFLGQKLGHVDQSIVSIITGVGATAFIFSNYAAVHAKRLYKWYAPSLSFFERKSTQKEIREELGELTQHIVLIGANRMGNNILESLDGKNDNMVVVDFDPDIVDVLNQRGIKALFGDISDPDIQDHIRLKDARLVISTVSDMDDNLSLLYGMKKVKAKGKIVVLAQDHEDAKELYQKGADYVIVPHIIGGRHVVKLLKDESLEILDEYKSKDLKYLKLTD